jgi:small subunit ribosomal protein S13
MKKNIYQQYLTRYGLGKNLVMLMFLYSGLHPQCKKLRIGYLADRIRNFILSHEQQMDTNLKRKVQHDIVRLVKSRSYKALRLLKRLPVRGQRTRTNHRNAKRTLLMWR